MGQKQDSKCECTTVTARTWLIVFNCIFVFFGLALAVAGGILRFGKHLVSEYVDDMLKQVDTEDGDSIADILDMVAIVLMVVGVILLAFGLIGCFGGCCMVPCCLLVYSLIMVKLLVAEITLVIVWFVMRSMIEDKVKSAILGAIQTFYAGDTGTDAVSLGMNWMFVELDCCGVDVYTELHSATNWNRTQNFGGAVVTLATPFMCCKLSGSFPNINLPNTSDCAVTPNVTDSNFDSGCYEAFFEYVEPYHVTIIIIGSCIIVCEIVSAISAFILKKKARQRGRQVDDVPQTPVKKARLKEQNLSKNNMQF